MSFEAEFWARRIEQTVPNEAGLNVVVPSAAALFAAYQARNITLGQIDRQVSTLPHERWTQWARRRAEGLIGGFRGALQSSTNARTVSRAIGSFLRLSDRGLAGEIRTQHNATTESAKLSLDEENDLIRDLVWVSVLDTRTSDICFSRNGLLINRELNGQTPPAHINCRSVTVLGLRSWRQLGLTGLPEEARNELDGRLVGVEDAESSETWFNRQTRTTQLDILGPNRLALFEEGGLRFPNDLINQDEDRWTLEELRARDPMSFEDAGITREFFTTN